jgi:phosphoglycerate dehydrogenase-like enzyme
MTGNRPQVGLVCTAEVRDNYIDDDDLARLEKFADFHWQEFTEETSWDAAPDASDRVSKELAKFTVELDALVVCHGSPRVDDSVLSVSPKLKFVGELEGDRFAQRIDVAAATERDVRAIDTTHGSSYPVSEWALGLMLVGLRNAGAHFRRIIDGELWGSAEYNGDIPDVVQNEELTGKTVGLIGAGYIGRKLIELLKPFDVTILAHDPYVSSDLASSLGFTLTSLDNVLSIPDIVVCLVPLTPGTKGMLGEREILLIKPGAVFVNVSRGPVVDTAALIERLEKGDITACLDVFDPEPMPADSPIRNLRNVFLTPHIAGTTQRSRTRFFEEMVSELERHFAGHETQHNLTAHTLANRRGE